jgi:hypothetical protein
MTKVEKIIQQSRNLPEIYQTEVLDFVEYLEKKARIKTGGESQLEERQWFEDQGEENTRFSPRGKPTDFWQSPTLEELAVSQGVKPMTDVNIIVGTWPGTDDDRFEEDILALRKIHKIESSS